jgi:hypothetical protein
LSSNPDSTTASNDVLVAVRNTVKLGLSLIATWGIGLGIAYFQTAFELFEQRRYLPSTKAVTAAQVARAQ